MNWIGSFDFGQSFRKSPRKAGGSSIHDGHGSSVR